MSRIGKVPVVIPGGVTAEIAGGVLSVKGPKGTLTLTMRDEISYVVEDSRILVKHANDSKQTRAFGGRQAPVAANRVSGVTAGYHTAQIGKWHTGIDAGTGRDWDWQIVWNRPLHPDNAGHYYDQQILSFNGAERMTEGYSTDNYSQWASEFIKGEHRDASKPWYLWLCYGAIHGPTTPAARHKGLHKGDEVRVPADIFPPREGKPD